MLDRIFTHWKSSASGLLTAALVLLPMLTAPGGPLESSAHGKWYVEASMALGRIWIGFLQKDAGTELAQTSQGLKAVDSHETPNDPSATPVR